MSLPTFNEKPNLNSLRPSLVDSWLLLIRKKAKVLFAQYSKGIPLLFGSEQGYNPQSHINWLESLALGENALEDYRLQLLQLEKQNLACLEREKYEAKGGSRVL
ncbi:hypothetical protein S40288_11631 [Stachybotrys chartarum IBT 40288]|nr:hypothetical protein S40288_11631 [Stachybotrys chartarum IBT 40288]